MKKNAWVASRRAALKTFLASLAGAGLPVQAAATDALVRHLLPTASDTQLSITLSLWQARSVLTLLMGPRKIIGTKVDSEGFHWTFQVSALTPGTTYELQLADDKGPIYEPWPLKTLPARESLPESLTLLAFTCAGGGDGFGDGRRQFFKPHTFRQRMFEHALARNPDIAIAIGDHIYWDLRGGEAPWFGRNPAALALKYGEFDRTLPMLGTVNEAVLKRVGGEQIADLYGTRFRSTPIYFVSDDHDYFENDDAEAEIVTFPADAFSQRAHATMAKLFYPALPDAPVSSMARSFGTLRYGRLFEAPMFDCAGHMSLGGETASLVPAEIEHWLVSRAAQSEALHFALVPSHPFGWTAGKWREWYPDVVAPENYTGVVMNNLLGGTQGALTTKAQKYLWQVGWWQQHQRVLRALSQRSGSRFTFSGDIHAQGAVALTKSDELDLGKHPVQSLLVGPVSTSDVTWPSAARGIAAALPTQLSAESIVATKEVNGFTMFRFTPTQATAELYDCGGFDRTKGEDGRPQNIQRVRLT